MSTDLIPSVSVANMVNQRAGLISRMNQAFALIQEAADIAAASHLGMPRVLLSVDYGRGRDGIDIAAARIKTDSSGRPWDIERSPAVELEKKLRHGIDAAAWQYLMHQSGMRSLMDATARKEWDEAISRGEIPEFNDGNVRSTFRQLHGSREEIFDRGVIACFKSLAWDYKTNQPQKFGKRIVLTHLRGNMVRGRSPHSSGTSLGHVNYQVCDRLDDLSRVFSVLDGKPEPDHRQGWYSRFSINDKLGDPHPSDGYMSIRSFRNGNGHVTFERPELVDRMNLILAKHYPGALPAPK